MKQISVNDKVTFTNKRTGDRFIAKILEVRQYERYFAEILQGSAQHVGEERVINLSDPYVIEVESVEPFELDLAKQEVEKYLGLMSVAVEINDRVWFEECSAELTLWKKKVADYSEVKL